MPLQGYTIGRDVALDVMTSSGVLRFDKITKFTRKPKVGTQEIVPLNGQTDELQWPKGWNGTITIERTNSTADDWQAQWEDDYFNGVNRDPSTITETITESNGSVSVYRYENVQLHLTDAGDASGEKTVAQEFTWTARRRKKVA